MERHYEVPFVTVSICGVWSQTILKNFSNRDHIRWALVACMFKNYETDPFHRGIVFKVDSVKISLTCAHVMYVRDTNENR